jgi:CRP/FNR family transcriptional regulator
MNFKEFLETAPVFSGLTQHDIDDLEHMMRINKYPDGHDFFKEGTTGHHVHLIVEGEVSVTHKKGTQRGSLEIKHLEAGEMFGLLSAITNIKHEASCHAIGPVTIASIPNQAFKLLFDSNSTLGLHFLHLITAQLAKDYSSLVSLLRRALFAENEEEIKGTI